MGYVRRNIIAIDVEARRAPFIRRWDGNKEITGKEHSSKQIDKLCLQCFQLLFLFLEIRKSIYIAVVCLSKQRSHHYLMEKTVEQIVHTFDICAYEPIHPNRHAEIGPSARWSRNVVVAKVIVIRT